MAPIVTPFLGNDSLVNAYTTALGLSFASIAVSPVPPAKLCAV